MIPVKYLALEPNRNHLRPGSAGTLAIEVPVETAEKNGPRDALSFVQMAIDKQAVIEVYEQPEAAPKKNLSWQNVDLIDWAMIIGFLAVVCVAVGPNIAHTMSELLTRLNATMATTASHNFR